MNAFGTVHHDSINIDRTTPVRVQCEAQDCRALLEVNVTPEQRVDKPVIVRCGSCKRLLEVNLTQAQLVASNKRDAHQQHPTLQHQPLSYSGVATALTGSLAASNTSGYGFTPIVPSSIPPFRQRAETKSLLDQEFTLTSPPAIRQDVLIQPPPLSRHSSMQRKAVVDTLSSQLTGSSLWYSPAYIFGNSLFDPFAPSSSTLDTLPYLDLTSELMPTITMPKVKAKKQKSNRPRNPSPYNMFMSQEVKHIKATNPSVDHKEAFKMAASNWARSPNNCSNRRLPPPFKKAVDTDLPLISKEEALKMPVMEEQEGPELAMQQQVNVKRRISDVELEHFPVNEEKRIKTEMAFMEKPQLKTVLSVGEGAQAE